MHRLKSVPPKNLERAQARVPVLLRRIGHD
jgi:hypothetical protein